MNLPNKLTISRIALTAVFLFFLFERGLACKILAFFTFIAASLTDFLDGYIAKKYNLTSDFGRLMDPIADKILTLSAFLAFVKMEIIPAWMVVIIIIRELFVTGMRLAALRKRDVIGATLCGKYKTVSQMAVIFMVLLFIIFREFGWPFKEGIILGLMTVAVTLTIVSGVSFVLRNGKAIRLK